MSSVPHCIFGELFRLRTSHGALEKYFQTNRINRRNYYCGRGQLERVELSRKVIYILKSETFQENYLLRLIPRFSLIQKRVL